VAIQTGQVLGPLVVAGVLAVAAGAVAGYWAGSRGEIPPDQTEAPLRAELDALAERLTALEGAQIRSAFEDAAGAASLPGGDEDASAPRATGEPERAAAPVEDPSRQRLGGPGTERWMASLQELQSTRDPKRRLELARELSKSPLPPLRFEGFKALLELDPDEGLAAVRQMVADANRNPRTQRMAAQAIMLLGEVSGNAVEQELYTFAQSPTFGVQRAALRTLERRGDPGPMRATISVQTPELRSSDAGTRSRALREIGSLRSPSATPVILPLLADSDSGVRIQALEALGRTGGGAPAIAAVEPLLSDPVPAVRDTAVRTMQRLNRPDDDSRRSRFDR
jgi:hypothetical protein